MFVLYSEPIRQDMEFYTDMQCCSHETERRRTIRSIDIKIYLLPLGSAEVCSKVFQPQIAASPRAASARKN